MTNQEINMTIAGMKFPGREVVSLPMGQASIKWGALTVILDYINDWKLLGPLEDELLDAGRVLYKIDNGYEWVRPGRRAVFNSHRGMASGLAYIEEFGGE